MATTRYNPVREMITLREAMDQVFNDNYFRNRESRQQVWQLPIDAHATEDAIVIQADVPGLKPEELEVTLEGDTLTIRGELKARAEDRNYLLRERPTGRFDRVLTINTPLAPNNLKPNSPHSTLTLTFPHPKSVNPKP